MVRRVPYLGDGAQGVSLVSRVVYEVAGTFAPTIPEGASWCIIRGVGAGGTKESATDNYGAGGSAAYARVGFSVLPTDTIGLTVAAETSALNTDGADTIATKNGAEVLRAKGGKKGAGVVGGAGGLAADCVGDVKRSGGAGGTGGFTLASAKGAQGDHGPPVTDTDHSVGSPGSGTAASDIGDVDSLGPAGARIGTGMKGFGCGSNGGNAVSDVIGTQGQRGKAFVEFFTGNPYP